jgi:hypothetical protein
MRTYPYTIANGSGEDLTFLGVVCDQNGRGSRGEGRGSALGSPALVIPTHADAYGDPKPSEAALADRKRFEQEVGTASPSSRYLFPNWFEPILVEAPNPGTPAVSASGREVLNPRARAPLVPAYSVKDMADYAPRNAAYIELFRTAPPARATLSVTALPRPAAHVEIICSARISRR